MVQTVTSSKFTYKSDLPTPSPPTTGGILHATRTSHNTHEQTFAYTPSPHHIPTLLSHLSCYGFSNNNNDDDDDIVFIPYSSKENWHKSYPHAVICVECDEGGNVSGYPFLHHNAGGWGDVPEEARAFIVNNSTTVVGNIGGGGRKRARTMTFRKKGKRGSKLFTSAALYDLEREELHKEIYRYFKWFKEQIGKDNGGGDTTDAGRSVTKAGINVNGLDSILDGLESTFKVVRQVVRDEGGTNVDDAFIDGEGGGDKRLPLLEESLEEELNIRAEAAAQAASNEVKQRGVWEPLDFETMFEKLQRFKEEHNHVNVPVKYKEDPQLGHWVSGLRTKKKALDEKGIDLDYEDAQPSKPDNGGSVRYLDKEKMDRLDSIGFSWSMMRGSTAGRAPPKSFDENLQDLHLFYQQYGKWPSRSDPLGNFVKDLRKSYSKKNEKFMKERAPKLDRIGFQWVGTNQVEEVYKATWDEKVQKLVSAIAFHQTNLHFEVPRPVSEEVTTGGDEGNSKETFEQFQFWQWVKSLRPQYKKFMSGKKSLLNEERVKQLTDIGYNLALPSLDGDDVPQTMSEVVPDLPWETRMKQIQDFSSKFGHLNIDHNVKSQGNLGGFAVQMTSLYNSWKAGADTSPDMIAKFQELAGLGFAFNIYPKYEGYRNWDQQYNELVKYKQRNGSARVPLKYKADMRLGTWLER
eukprot:scaffold7117_cov199-Alexandrium_tamarense.AAC.1